ncbi:hypothetical protein PAPYR_7574 [Paratrimastix pyriformis]|uniref:Uncharacterized protein n=1 Tax=Paratrimastix pyriformis TaxID=342808 RepID=A0ABQ8UJV1_9EUKA|nr:hypothetical protein PAPYR_7574 [Paratrimastix pyriformis]
MFIGFQPNVVTDQLAAAVAHPDSSLFAPSKITKIYIEVNGSKNIPYLNQRELSFSGDNGFENFGQAYSDLMRCTKFYDNKSVSSIVSRSMFRNGYTIFAFDLHENIKDLPELNSTPTSIKLKIKRDGVTDDASLNMIRSHHIRVTIFTMNTFFEICKVFLFEGCIFMVSSFEIGNLITNIIGY